MSDQKIEDRIRQKKAEISQLELEMKAGFSNVLGELKPARIAIRAAGGLIGNRLTPINLVKPVWVPELPRWLTIFY